MLECMVRDTVKPGRTRMNDAGQFVAEECPISRTGVQQYRAYELGLDGIMDPMRVVRLDRPSAEVFDAVSVNSFDRVPVTLDHPAGGVVTDSTRAALTKGAVEAPRASVREGVVMARLVVVSADAIKAIQEGTSQLSCGYAFSLDMTPGKNVRGEAYDGIQRNIRGNHVALVDAARCGAICRIGDSHNTERSQTMDLRKVSVNGIQIEANDAAASAIEALQAQLSAAQTALDAASKLTADQAAALQSTLAAKDAELSAMSAKLLTPAAVDALVVDRTALLEAAKRLAPSVTTDGKVCEQIRREVVAAVIGANDTAKTIASAVLGGTDVAVADAALVRSTLMAIDAALGQVVAADADAAADALSAALTSSGSAGKDKAPVLVGRDAMLARSRGLSQQK